MIDIHAHVLPFVDDGSKSIEASLKMVAEAESQGVTTIICTPHYRYGFFESGKELVAENFELIKTKAKEKGLAVELLLGQEIHYNKYVKAELKDNFYYTLNNSEYVLIEFSFSKREEIGEVVYSLSIAGYKPIVAHYERYAYATLEDAYEIHSLGGEIQINASSVTGKYGAKIKKLAGKLLKNGLVDYVAGDVHETRPNQMREAAAIIEKKYGKDTKDKLFYINAKRFCTT